MSVATQATNLILAKFTTNIACIFFGSTHKHDMLFEHFTKINPYFG